MGQAQATFKNGKKHGAELEFFESGQLHSKTPYKNGDEHGVR